MESSKMFNVIPPINGRNVGFAPQKNKISQQNSTRLAPLSVDTVSFTGVKVLDFKEITGKFPEAKLSLSESKISHILRRTAPEEYMRALSKEVAEIAAKRLDYQGIVNKAESGSFGHPPHRKIYPGTVSEPSTFIFHPAKQPLQRYSMDWSEQYNTLRNVFEETGAQDRFAPTKYDFEAAKGRLFEELKKLSLI